LLKSAKNDDLQSQEVRDCREDSDPAWTQVADPDLSDFAGGPPKLKMKTRLPKMWRLKPREEFGKLVRRTGPCLLKILNHRKNYEPRDKQERRTWREPAQIQIGLVPHEPMTTRTRWGLPSGEEEPENWKSEQPLVKLQMVFVRNDSESPGS
jgi:hypothetical protein